MNAKNLRKAGRSCKRDKLVFWIETCILDSPSKLEKSPFAVFARWLDLLMHNVDLLRLNILMASRLGLQAAAAQGMAAHPDAEMGSVGAFLDALHAWQHVLGAPTHNIFRRMLA